MSGDGNMSDPVGEREGGESIERDDWKQGWGGISGIVQNPGTRESPKSLQG